MITQFECSTLFEDSAYLRGKRFLDDLKLIMICAGISMAKKSGNPLWAQSLRMCDEFDSLYREYSKFLNDKFELKYTHMLCEYIGFMINRRLEPGNRLFIAFQRSTYYNFTEALDFLKEILDNNVHQKFFKTLQPHTDFTNLYVNANNFCDIISNTPDLKEDLLSAIDRLEDRIGDTEFFKMAKKYAISCI